MDSSKLIPRFAIVASTQKLVDRFLFTGSQPTNPTKKLNLLYAVEVTRPWFPSSRLVPTITNVLSERFNTLAKSSNPLKSFEATIKNINEELYAITEQGETDWLGHLNALLILVDGNEIHISQTGTAQAYLFRARKISQVTETSVGDSEPHPLSTFSNIISGQLAEGDRMVFANQDLFSIISLDQIRGAVSEQTPFLAANQIVKSTKRSKITSISAIILAIENAATWETAGEEPFVINLEETVQGWHKIVWKNTKPILKKARSISKKAWKASVVGAKKAHSKWQESYGPKTQSALKSGARSISHYAAKAKGYTKDKFSDKSVQGKTLQSFVKAEQWLTDLLKPLKKSAAPILKKLNQVDRKLGGLIKKLSPYVTGKNFRYVLISAAILFVAITAITVRNRHSIQVIANTQSENLRLLEETNLLAGRTDEAIKLKQTIEAQKLLAQAEEKLNQVNPTNSDEETRKDSLLQIIQEKGDKLTNTQRVNATTSYKAPENTDIIAVSNRGIYALNSKSNAGRFLSRDLAQSEIQFTLPSADDKPISAFYSSELDSVFITTANKKVFTARLENDSITISQKENPLGDFADSTDIATFGTNLYLLDSNSGLLWKYPPSGDNFSRGINQVEPTDINLKTAIDIAIDGYIYSLHSDGSLKKLLRGKPESDFSVADMPETSYSRKLIALSTNENIESIYLFDAGDSSKSIPTAKVIVLNKDGSFLKQIAIDEQLSNIKAWQMQADGSRFWILNSNEIVEYKI